MNVSRRWQTATEYRETLEKLLNQTESPEVTTTDIWRRIESYVAQPHVKAVADLGKILAAPLDEVRKVIYQLRERLAGGFEESQTGASYDTSEGFHQIMYAFAPLGKSASKQDWITFRADAVGTEMIVTATRNGDVQTLLRTSLDAPNLGGDFPKAIERVCLKQIQDAMGREIG